MAYMTFVFQKLFDYSWENATTLMLQVSGVLALGCCPVYFRKLQGSV
ncbi:MAG: hypothetical protein ACRDNG_10915 [Gaiellaceae bacterium]